jgi:hypothetical protein
VYMKNLIISIKTLSQLIILSNQNYKSCQTLGLVPVILAPQKVEIRRITVLS